MDILFSIIYASLSLSVLFSSYLAISSLSVITYGIYGFYSYIIIYFFNIFGALSAPYIVYHILGVKWTILVGASTYIIYIIAYCSNSNLWLLLGSAITGFGAGLMRSQQNTWITSITDTNVSFYVGIYNSIFSFSSILGFGISATLSYFGIPLNIIIWILTGLGIISCISFIFSKNIDVREEHKVSIGKYVEVMKDTDLLLIYPLIFYQVLSMGISYGILPILFTNEIYATYGYLIYGITLCLVSYINGWITKRIDYKWLIYDNSIIMLILCLTIILHQYFYNNELLLLLAFLISGCNEAICIFSIICILSEFQYKLIYGNHRAIYCIFSMLIMFIIPYATITGYLILLFVCNICATLCYKYYVNNKEYIILIL